MYRAVCSGGGVYCGDEHHGLCTVMFTMVVFTVLFTVVITVVFTVVITVMFTVVLCTVEMRAVICALGCLVWW